MGPCMTARAIARRSLLARPLLVQPVPESAVVNIISARLEYLRNHHGISSRNVLFLAEDRWKLSALPTEVWADTVANFFLQQKFPKSEYQQKTILSFPETLSYFRGCIYDLHMDQFRPLGSPDRYVESMVGLFEALHKNCISPDMYSAHVNNHLKSWPQEYAERQVELSRAFTDFHDCCRRDNVTTKWGALHHMLKYESLFSDHFISTTNSKYFSGDTGVHVFIRGLQNLSLLELRLLRGMFLQGQDGALQHGKVHSGKKQRDQPNVSVIGFNDFSSSNLYPSNIVETIFQHNGKPDFEVCTFVPDYEGLPCSTDKVPQHIHFEFSNGEEELRSLCQRIENQIKFYNNKIAVVARRLKDARRVAKSLRAYGFEVVSHGNVEVPLTHDISVRASLALLAVVEAINARGSDLSEADGMLSDQDIFTIMSSYECIPLAKMMAALSKSRENRSSTLSTLEQDSVFRKMIDDINHCAQTYFFHISRGDIPAAQIAVVKQFIVQRDWSKPIQKSLSEIDERRSQNMEDFVTLVSQSNGNVEFLRSRCAIWSQRRNVRADPNKCVHVYSMVQLRREVMSGTKPFEAVYVYGMCTGRLPSIMSGRLQTRAPPGLPVGVEHGPPYAFDAFSSHAKAAKFARECHQENELKLLLSTSTDVAARVISSSSLRYGSEKNEIKPSPWLKDGVLGNVLFLNGRKKSPANQKRSDQVNYFSGDCLPLHDPDTIYSLMLEKGKHIKYLSFSQINLYERCPKSYMMKYILNIPSGTPSAIMVYGSLMHEVIAEFWTFRAERCNLVNTVTNKEGSMSAMKTKMMKSFSEKWHQVKDSALFFSPAHFEALHDAGRTGICHFVDRYFNVPSPIGIEQVFTASLPGHDGIELKGVFDLIDHTGAIVEFKSNKVGLAGEKGVEKIASSSLQPVLYAMARPEAPEVVVEGVENGHRVHVSIGDERIKKAQNAIDMVVDGIQNANYRPTSSFFTCSFCDYRRVCSDSVNP